MGGVKLSFILPQAFPYASSPRTPVLADRYCHSLSHTRARVLQGIALLAVTLSFSDFPTIFSQKRRCKGSTYGTVVEFLQVPLHFQQVPDLFSRHHGLPGKPRLLTGESKKCNSPVTRACVTRARPEKRIYCQHLAHRNFTTQRPKPCIEKLHHERPRRGAKPTKPSARLRASSCPFVVKPSIRMASCIFVPLRGEAFHPQGFVHLRASSW